MPHSARHFHARRRRGGLLVAALTVCLYLVGVLGWLGYAFVFNNRDGVAAGRADHRKGRPAVLSTTSCWNRGRSRAAGIPKSSAKSNQKVTAVSPFCGSSTRVPRSTPATSWSNLTRPPSRRNCAKTRSSVTAATANVTSAEALVEQAKIAREEYLQGLFKTEESAIQSEIAVAEQELAKPNWPWKAANAWSPKASSKNCSWMLTSLPLINAKTKVESAEARLNVLQNLTKKKDVGSIR